MANISLRGLDQEIKQQLKNEASRRGKSVNALILQYISQRVGIPAKRERRPRHHDLDRLAGTWSDEEARVFLDAISDFNTIVEAQEVCCRER